MCKCKYIDIKKLGARGSPGRDCRRHSAFYLKSPRNAITPLWVAGKINVSCGTTPALSMGRRNFGSLRQEAGIDGRGDFSVWAATENNTLGVAGKRHSGTPMALSLGRRPIAGSFRQEDGINRREMGPSSNGKRKTAGVRWKDIFRYAYRAVQWTPSNRQVASTRRQHRNQPSEERLRVWTALNDKPLGVAGHV